MKKKLVSVLLAAAMGTTALVGFGTTAYADDDVLEGRVDCRWLPGPDGGGSRRIQHRQQAGSQLVTSCFTSCSPSHKPEPMLRLFCIWRLNR